MLIVLHFKYLIHYLLFKFDFIFITTFYCDANLGASFEKTKITHYNITNQFAIVSCSYNQIAKSKTQAQMSFMPYS